MTIDLEDEKIFPKKIIEENGFYLEGRVFDIFKKKSFTVERNIINNKVEIDVLAHNTAKSKAVFVIECKGAKKDFVLVLRGNTDQFIKEDTKIFFGHPEEPYRTINEIIYKTGEPKEFDYYRGNICQERVSYINKLLFRHTHQGDFINKKNLKCSSKSSNFHKALIQTVQAVNELQPKLESIIAETPENVMPLFFRILPIIVTNATIYVTENSDTEIEEIGWAVHSCKSVDQKNHKINVQHAFIINIDALGDFIEKVI